MPNFQPNTKIIVLSAIASSAIVTAAPLTVPVETVTDLTTTATNFGGSALLVWGGVALAAIGLVIFKKIFK